MNLAVRFLLIVTIVIAVTDAIVYYHVKYRGRELTIPFLIGVIFITILPIAIRVWIWHQQGLL